MIWEIKQILPGKQSIVCQMFASSRRRIVIFRYIILRDYASVCVYALYLCNALLTSQSTLFGYCSHSIPLLHFHDIIIYHLCETTYISIVDLGSSIVCFHFYCIMWPVCGVSVFWFGSAQRWAHISIGIRLFVPGGGKAVYRSVSQLRSANPFEWMGVRASVDSLSCRSCWFGGIVSVILLRCARFLRMGRTICIVFG